MSSPGEVPPVVAEWIQHGYPQEAAETLAAEALRVLERLTTIAINIEKHAQSAEDPPQQEDVHAA